MSERVNESVVRERTRPDGSTYFIVGYSGSNPVEYDSEEEARGEQRRRLGAYDAGLRGDQIFDSTLYSAGNLTQAGRSAAATEQNPAGFSETSVIGGQEFATPGTGDELVGILDLARGLAAAGIDLPEQQLAELTPDQREAFRIAREGIGSFQPLVDQASGRTLQGILGLQDALTQTRFLGDDIKDATGYGIPRLVQAAEDVQRFAGEGAGALQTGAGDVQQFAGEGAGALQTAAGDVQQFAGEGAGALQTAAGDAMRFTEQGVQDARQAADRSYLAGEQARDLAADVTGRARSLQAPLESDLAQTTAGTRGIAAAGMSGADLAAARARGSTAEAQQALQNASRLGQLTALEGIAQLEGTGARFSPDQVDAFMSDYEDAAVQQALADIARQGELQEQQIGAQAVQAGAFGGSRQAVAEQELARNILEQQGRTAAQMRASGYESAAQRAQQAFEQSQGRQQNVAQLTGQLGQVGSGAAAGAAEAAGRLGLSAEQLAQQSALQGAQLGMSAEQFAAANAQAVAQTGLNIEQLAAQTGMNAQQLAGQMAQQAGQLGIAAGQLGVQGSQAAGAMGAQAGQMQMQGAQTAGAMGAQAGQMQMQGAQTAGAMGAQAGQMQMQGAQAAGDLGLQASNLGLAGVQAGLGAQQQAAGISQGIAGLGQQFIGQAQAGQQLQQQDINTLLGIGGQQQRQDQAALDVAYQNQFQQATQPFQQLAYYSDIVTGAPSGQSSVMTQPGPSIGSQLIGLGTAAYGLNQAGII